MPLSFLQLVLAKTQEKAASSLTEVSWLGKKVPVKSEKMRVGFIKLQQLEGEVSRVEGSEGKMEVYERLLMECQDTMQLVRDEVAAELVSTWPCHCFQREGREMWEIKL